LVDEARSSCWSILLHAVLRKSRSPQNEALSERTRTSLVEEDAPRTAFAVCQSTTAMEDAPSRPLGSIAGGVQRGRAVAQHPRVTGITLIIRRSGKDAVEIHCRAEQVILLSR